MNRHFTATILLLTALSSGVAFAAPFNKATPDQVKSVRAKVVHLSFRNDRQNTVTIAVGDTELTLAPGQSVTEKLKSGDQVVAKSGFEQAAGTILFQITPSLDGDTISFHRS